MLPSELAVKSKIRVLCLLPLKTGRIIPATNWLPGGELGPNQSVFLSTGFPPGGRLQTQQLKKEEEEEKKAFTV